MIDFFFVEPIEDITKAPTILKPKTKPTPIPVISDELVVNDTESQQQQVNKNSNLENDDKSSNNQTLSEKDDEKAASMVDDDFVKKILIGIIIVACVGLIIGVICRKDVCGIKTKMCRRKPRTSRNNGEETLPEEVPLNKMSV